MGDGYSIEELSDQREIEVLMHRYATGIDTADYDLVGTIFAPGGTIDYQSLGGPAGVEPTGDDPNAAPPRRAGTQAH